MTIKFEEGRNKYKENYYSIDLQIKGSISKEDFAAVMDSISLIKKILDPHIDKELGIEQIKKAEIETEKKIKEKIENIPPFTAQFPQKEEIVEPKNKPTMDAHERRKPWSKKFDACIICGTTERKHMGKGRCTKCYFIKDENIVEGEQHEQSPHDEAGEEGSFCAFQEGCPNPNTRFNKKNMFAAKADMGSPLEYFCSKTCRKGYFPELFD